MKFKNLSIMTTKLKTLLEFHAKGFSQRRISAYLELSRTSVKNYLSRLLESGKTIDELLQLPDDELLKLSCKETFKQSPDSRYEILEPLLEIYHQKSQRKYVTIQLIWEEYVEEYGIDKTYSYTTFKHHLQEYQKSCTYTYHNTHQPGDVLQVDFAGDKLYLTDIITGKKMPVELLCCILPCSNLLFIYAMLDSCCDNLFNGISKSLEYIGGVPNRILSDNMKQWVTKRDKYEPSFTDAALEFGFHYSTIIKATGVRKPKHKATVESSVQQTYQRVYAKIADDVFYDINELNAILLELLHEFNNRQMQHHDHSRFDYFNANEKGYLNPLPSNPFKLKYTKRCKISSNYHFYINTHQYSVPYEYVNKEVIIIYDVETVEVYDTNFSRITSHKRSHKKYGYTTNIEHMPERHKAYEKSKGLKDTTSYLEKAESISPLLKQVIEHIINNGACIEQAYTSCELILQLYKIHPDELIPACEYAINNLKQINFSIIKQIITNKIYLKREVDIISHQIIHSNLRGKDEFLN